MKKFTSLIVISNVLSFSIAWFWIDHITTECTSFINSMAKERIENDPKFNKALNDMQSKLNKLRSETEDGLINGKTSPKQVQCVLSALDRADEYVRFAHDTGLPKGYLLLAKAYSYKDLSNGDCLDEETK